jgi:ABC-2 type transport system permease protein
MNRFAWLMRRELWEHRAIWAAPAIVLALLLLGSVTGNVFMGDIHINADIGQDGAAGGQGALSDEDIAELESIRGVEDLHKLERLEKLDKAPGEKFNSVPAGEAFSMLPPEKRESVVAVIYALVTAVMFLVLGSIGFFYSLDALYSDRRDRSILFWKSLPLSDAETVLAKFCMAAAAIPVIAAAASIVGQLVLATGVSLKFALTGGEAGLLWAPQVLAASSLASLVLALVCALWFAPLVAYLLLASSWAPKSPFLWAVLPPIAAVMLEKIAFGTKHFSEFMQHRMMAPFETMFRDQNPGDTPVAAMDVVSNLLQLFTSPGMLLGLVAAAALLAGAIWLRRYRDETT